MTTTTGGRGDREVLAEIIYRCREWAAYPDLAGLIADDILAAGFGRGDERDRTGDLEWIIEAGIEMLRNGGSSALAASCWLETQLGKSRDMAAHPSQPDAIDKPSGSHEGTGVISHWYQCDHCGNASREYFSVCDECGKMECMRVEARPVRPASLCSPQQQQTGRDGGGGVTMDQEILDMRWLLATRGWRSVLTIYGAAIDMPVDSEEHFRQILTNDRPLLRSIIAKAKADVK